MNLLRFFILGLFGLLFVPAAPLASADAISPTLLFYEVDPGEEFEFDLVFSSTAGGEYDVLLKALTFSPEGEKKYEDTDDGVLALEGDVLQFSAGEQRYVPVKVRVPIDALPGDLNTVIGLRQRTQASFSFELSSVVVLSIGEGHAPEADLSSVQFRYDAEDAGVLQGVDYQLVNTSGRAFVATPELEFFDEQGESQVFLKGLRNVFFPFDRGTSTLLFKPDQDIFLTQDLKKGVFRLVASSDFRWQRELVDIPLGAKISPQEKVDFPLELSYRERRLFDFLYHPIFKGFAILIGLTLITISFLMEKKKS